MPNIIYQCVGTNQTHGSYNKRMHDYYNTHKLEGCHRSHLAIQGRWGKIQRYVNKLCGFKIVVDHRNESGKNEQDRVTPLSFILFVVMVNIYFELLSTFAEEKLTGAMTWGGSEGEEHSAAPWLVPLFLSSSSCSSPPPGSAAWWWWWQSLLPGGDTVVLAVGGVEFGFFAPDPK
jgi:hypothetical protein